MRPEPGTGPGTDPGRPRAWTTAGPGTAVLMTHAAHTPDPAERPFEDDPELGGSPVPLRDPDAVDDPEADAEDDLEADMEAGHAT